MESSAEPFLGLLVASAVSTEVCESSTYQSAWKYRAGAPSVYAEGMSQRGDLLCTLQSLLPVCVSSGSKVAMGSPHWAAVLP